MWLFRYMHNIGVSAARFSGWGEYDRQFRFNMIGKSFSKLHTIQTVVRIPSIQNYGLWLCIMQHMFYRLSKGLAILITIWVIVHRLTVRMHNTVLNVALNIQRFIASGE